MLETVISRRSMICRAQSLRSVPISHDQLSCTLQPGTGTDLDVLVTVAGQVRFAAFRVFDPHAAQTSQTSSLAKFSFNRPTVTSIEQTSGPTDGLLPV